LPVRRSTRSALSKRTAASEWVSTGHQPETQGQHRLRCCLKRRAGFARAPLDPLGDEQANRSVYLTRESILNIGKYMEITITPTMAPTMIIIRGSMIEVSVEIAESTSSS
jgi:hypothetical protein